MKSRFFPIVLVLGLLGGLARLRDIQSQLYWSYFRLVDVVGLSNPHLERNHAAASSLSAVIDIGFLVTLILVVLMFMEKRLQWWFGVAMFLIWLATAYFYWFSLD